MLYDKYLIDKSATGVDALKKIDAIPKERTLFVINEKGKIIGALTDGNIRRGLLAGKEIHAQVTEFITRDFIFQKHGSIDVEQIKYAKQKGIKLIPVINSSNELVKIYNLKNLESVLPVEAIIMAGGEGRRLRPLTEDTPKPMLVVGDKPIIEHNIDRLISFGIERIQISVNYLAEKITNYFGDGSSKGISISYIHESVPLGTIGALSLMKEPTHKNILVMNSDLFTNIDFEDLFFEYSNNNADMAIASIPYTVNIPYAIFERNDSIITGFREKPNNTHYANAGIYLFKKELLGLIPTSEKYHATDFLQKLIDLKKKIIHNPITGYWIDIGKMEDYLRVKEIIKHISV